MNNRYLIFIIYILCSPLAIHAKRPKPLIRNVSELEYIKSNPSLQIVVKSTLETADQYCNENPIVVVGEKYLSFAPNEHYLCSMGPYRWPDSNSPTGYVLRDGKVNPNWDFYDSVKLTIMALRCKKLSEAFYYSNDLKYYNTFIRQLHAWFVDEETMMLPNFEYSQVIPGQNNNKGTSSGMIDAYVFNTVIESIRLVNSVKRIDNRTYKKLSRWFKEFANWADNAYGEYFSKVNNNISLAYDVTMIDMYLFAGEKRKAKRIANSFEERRIKVQINDEGMQPEELKRTRAFFYSIYNLAHIIDFCNLMRYWDKEYYLKSGARIELAFYYLQQYYENPESFPFQQISGWEECRKLFVEQRNRMELLKNN